MYATEATAANAMTFAGAVQTSVHPANYISLHSQAYIQLDRTEGNTQKDIVA